MPNIISFLTPNFVARQLNYHMTGGWGQGWRATNDYFQPIETYAERLDPLLQEIVAMRFHALDLWTAHLNPNWATDDHVAIAKDLFQKYNLQVLSLAGGFGDTPEEFQRHCHLAVQLDLTILAGNTAMFQKDRNFVVRTLSEHGLRFGLENHPQKTPQEVLEQIGEENQDVIGIAIDTGWFGTQGYNAARAIAELAERLVHVHLKDVLAAGAHDTCRFGEGVVPVQACVEALKQANYPGPIGIEHEPEHFDPTPDIIASREMLAEWLGK